MNDIEQAVALLRENGWTCLPPATAEIPRIEVGQVWASPNPKTEPRTVTKIGPHRGHQWAGDRCIYFTTPKRQPEQRQWGIAQPVLHEEAFVAWIKKSGARPMPQEPGAEVKE